MAAMLEMETCDEDEEIIAFVSEDTNCDSERVSLNERNKIRRNFLVLSASGFAFLMLKLMITPPTFFTLSTQNVTRLREGTNPENGEGRFDASDPRNNEGQSLLEYKKYPQVSCPSLVHRAKNFDPESFEQAYTNVSKHIIHENVTAFIESFRNEEFDGWGKKFNEVKSALHDWKIRHYASNLKDGDSIFESACGIGLNLLLTLESIQEVKPLTNVKVYGNEYIADSVTLANTLLGTLLPQMNLSKGAICQGDSTDLSFVPSNSFDLVFTGYLSTLLDPLNFNARDQKETYALYEHICATRAKDWRSKKLAEISQQRQDEWFGLWVSEMVRIAKSGAPVIIEQVSRPYCNDMNDWGGVSRRFWKRGIDRYGWDIDPSSIVMENDKVFGFRYHVFMRKNS